MNTHPTVEPPNPGRRQFFRRGMAATLLMALASLGAWLTRRKPAPVTVWQLDPAKCVQCGQCATACVLNPSAVKCVHAYSLCGYCKLCFGYFEPGAAALTTAAESQLCPTGAIQRTFVEEPYFEYSIREDLCIGCAKCVKGCTLFGNGSLFLQVRHDRCVNCNDCAIARACPARAYRRVPATQPYLLKGRSAVASSAFRDVWSQKA
jgi:Na+-translocating ferredoxin:NAD+ oxidoreductase subunit B